jgi:hypothetical protein
LSPDIQRCFVAWVAALTGTPEGVIAIDGKTARRSGHKRKGQAPIHMVSAFAAGQRLVLGQAKVAEKAGGRHEAPVAMAIRDQDAENHYDRRATAMAATAPKAAAVGST